jgi:hypothetical protein
VGSARQRSVPSRLLKVDPFGSLFDRPRCCFKAKDNFSQEISWSLAQANIVWRSKPGRPKSHAVVHANLSACQTVLPFHSSVIHFFPPQVK